MKHTKEFIEKAKRVSKQGVNIYMMVNHFYKKSKLREPLPEEVLIKVMDAIILRGDVIVNSWPYFLRVLREESRKYFAEREEKANKGKRDGFAKSIANIMKGI